MRLRYTLRKRLEGCKIRHGNLEITIGQEFSCASRREMPEARRDRWPQLEDCFSAAESGVDRAGSRRHPLGIRLQTLSLFQLFRSTSAASRGQGLDRAPVWLRGRVQDCSDRREAAIKSRFRATDSSRSSSSASVCIAPGALRSACAEARDQVLPSLPFSSFSSILGLIAGSRLPAALAESAMPPSDAGRIRNHP